jgi:hypothetical protein
LVIRQADFSPTDPNIICVTGNEMFRIFKIGEGTFKPLPLNFKREALDYSCHAWLPDDMMVVASRSGEIILFHNFEFCAIIAPPDGRAICSLHPFSKVSIAVICFISCRAEKLTVCFSIVILFNASFTIRGSFAAGLEA